MCRFKLVGHTSGSPEVVRTRSDKAPTIPLARRHLLQFRWRVVELSVHGELCRHEVAVLLHLGCRRRRARQRWWEEQQTVALTQRSSDDDVRRWSCRWGEGGVEEQLSAHGGEVGA
jgi:hypothetical protein